MYETLFNYLKENNHRRMSSKFLKRQFNLTDVDIRNYIHQMRINGEPIISNSKGYKYSIKRNELLDTYLSLKNRGISILEAAAGIKNYLDENEIV